MLRIHSRATVLLIFMCFPCCSTVNSARFIYASSSSLFPVERTWESRILPTSPSKKREVQTNTKSPILMQHFDLSFFARCSGHFFLIFRPSAPINHLLPPWPLLLARMYRNHSTIRAGMLSTNTFQSSTVPTVVRKSRRRKCQTTIIRNRMPDGAADYGGNSLRTT